MKVRDLVEKKPSTVISIGSRASVGEAARLLIEHGVGGLPVLDEADRLVGFVSERVVVEALDRHGGDVREVRVADIMRRPPTCDLDDSLVDVMTRMTRERHRHLVPVSGGRPAGIISVGDILKNRLDQLEIETGVLRDYAAARRVR